MNKKVNSAVCHHHIKSIHTAQRDESLGSVSGSEFVQLITGA